MDDELEKSIKRCQSLIRRARKSGDMRAEAQALSAMRDFQNIQSRYKIEHVISTGSVDERLAALLADGELCRAFLDWTITRKTETPEEAIIRLTGGRISAA